jgi:uncharacterized membrane protein
MTLSLRSGLVSCAISGLISNIIPQKSQWAEYRGLIKINRKWLSRFSRSIAENIAYKNAERLFGRKGSGHLLGTL